MSLVTLGVSHHGAPVALREQINFTADDIPTAIEAIRREKLASEVVMLSTCNRTELYLTEAQSSSQLYQWLSDSRKISLPILEKHTYLYREKYASRHLFRVATGLDSLALGEPQILGQVKEAYRIAKDNNGVQKTLNRLFQEAFHVAKNIRTLTKLGENSISVVYAGVKLSERFFSRYQDLTVLVIGAGQTGELAVKTLKKKGVTNFLIANRTLSKAQHLASSVNGYALSLEQLPSKLHEADIIISATGRGEYTVTESALKQAQQNRRQRMQLLIDLAVPRDIEPSIRQLSNSYLFSVDDLQEIIDANIDLRQQAALEAEELVDESNQYFCEWLELRNHHRLIKGLHDFNQTEKEKLTAQALKNIAQGEDPERVIEELATKLTKKLSHQPSLLVRQASEKGLTNTIELIVSLYHLD